MRFKENMKNPRVQILMATYNGEKYTRAQLDSILTQTFKNIKILARDDGSTDKTIDILEEYQSKGLIQYYKGNKNIGATRSFFDLMHRADNKCDFFAFADQDDCWLPDKILTAVKRVSRFDNSIPILYFSQYTVVDEDLKPTSVKPKKIKKMSFGNALVEHSIIGCTAVFNKKTLEYMNMICAPYPPHDTFMHLLVTAVGKVIFDHNSYILYRQHSSNASLGSGSNLIDSIKVKAGKLKLLINSKSLTSDATSLRSLVGMGIEISDKNYKLLEKFLSKNESFINRVKFIFDREFSRQIFFEDITIKVLVLFGVNI